MREEWVKHFNDLHTASETATNILGGSPWYRGQAVASWKLVPSVFRTTSFNYEGNISARFVARAKARMQQSPPNTDLGAWLSLMRHHGLPTRLLDWSDSLLVAAFFVVADTATRSEDGCIWALDPTCFNKHQVNQCAFFPINHALSIPILSAAFGQKQIDRYLAVQPAHVDLRMLLQQSNFTVHGGATPLEALPHADDYLIRFVVPAACKASLAQSLRNMGTNESTIFPELDHLAKYLSSLEFLNEETLPTPSAV